MAEGLLVHGFKEFFIALGPMHLVQQELHGFHHAELGQHLAQDPDAIEIFFRDQQFFFSGSGLVDIDGRENALVHEAPV